MQGSPRENGSTATLLGWIEEELQAGGHEVEHVHIAGKELGGCISCFACQQDPDELVCSVQDDAQAIFASMTEADAAIYATPLYCGGFTGQFKPFLDRHLCLITGLGDPATHRSHVEGKRAGLLVTCGGPDAEGNTDLIRPMFRRMIEFGKCEAVAELVVPGLMSADNLTDEHKEQAKAFAEQLVG
jgi:multimeric flavodoxin WrbA